MDILILRAVNNCRKNTSGLRIISSTTVGGLQKAHNAPETQNTDTRIGLSGCGVINQFGIINRIMAFHNRGY